MSIQVVVFDLDDTLYDENDYIRSGIRVVAEYLSECYNWSFVDIDRQLQQSLAVNRKNILDRVLKQKGAWSETLVADCDAIFREHIPNIRLSHQTKRLLKVYAKDFAVYVVTAGDSLIQQNKLEVLGLTTNNNIKQTIKLNDNSNELLESLASLTKIENCGARDLVFISGATNREFNTLKEQGFNTIRMITDTYRDGLTRDEQNDELQADNLSSAYDLLKQFS